MKSVRNKKKHITKKGSPPRANRRGAKHPPILLWIVLAGVLLLMIFLFLGNYMLGPRQELPHP